MMNLRIKFLRNKIDKLQQVILNNNFESQVLELFNRFYYYKLNGICEMVNIRLNSKLNRLFFSKYNYNIEDESFTHGSIECTDCTENVNIATTDPYARSSNESQVNVLIRMLISCVILIA